MNRINELISQRLEMERDAIKYIKMGYYAIASHLIDVSKTITNEIHEVILKGGAK